MKIVSEKKLNFQNYFGDSKFGMEVDLIETIQKSYILHVQTVKTELRDSPKASALGSPHRSDARSYNGSIAGQVPEDVPGPREQEVLHLRQLFGDGRKGEQFSLLVCFSS